MTSVNQLIYDASLVLSTMRETKNRTMRFAYSMHTQFLFASEVVRFLQAPLKRGASSVDFRRIKTQNRWRI